MKKQQSATVVRNATEVEAVIRKGIEENLSIEQMANLLQSGTGSVRRWAKVLGIRIPRKRSKQPKNPKIEEFHKMRQSGCTLDQIGKAHGVTREYVRQALNRWYPDEVFPSFHRKKTACKTCGAEFHSHSGKAYCSIRCRNLDKNINVMSRDLALVVMSLRDQGMTWEQVHGEIRMTPNSAAFRVWLQRHLHFFSSAERQAYFPVRSREEQFETPHQPKSFIRRLLGRIAH